MVGCGGGSHFLLPFFCLFRPPWPRFVEFDEVTPLVPDEAVGDGCFVYDGNEGKDRGQFGDVVNWGWILRVEQELGDNRTRGQDLFLAVR